MPGASRIVERLRLRADSESAVRRALPCLEDAFRTATLLDAGARLIFVRTLHLGKLPRGASAQSLSLAIESRFSEAGWQLVHAGSPGAAGAGAVWFRDGLEAHELAALRAAAGRPIDAWFWRLAVPAVATAASAGDTLRAIAFSVASLDEAPAALPAWTQALAEGGHVGQLLTALRPGDGAALLRAAGIVIPPSDRPINRDSRPGSADAVLPDAPRRRSVSMERAGWPSAALDDRHRFTEMMLSRAPFSGLVRHATSGLERSDAKAHPFAPGTGQDRARGMTIAPSEAPVASAAASVQSAGGCRIGLEHARLGAPGERKNGPARLQNEMGPAVPVNPQKPAGIAAVGRTMRQPAAPVQLATPEARSVVPQLPPGSNAGQSDSPKREARRRVEQARSIRPFLDVEPTAAGGLLFLVPALERLGFREWSADLDSRIAAPDVFAGRIFHLLLSRLEVGEGDPAWRLAVPELKLPDRRLVVSAFGRKSNAGCGLRAEAGSHTYRRGVASAFRRKIDPNTPQIWLSACRRLLRRRARIGLASLVFRPAHMALTPTHVDVFFALTAADVRVRRAGLDLDPGWVAWLRRVVSFHYSELHLMGRRP